MNPKTLIRCVSMLATLAIPFLAVDKAKAGAVLPGFNSVTFPGNDDGSTGQVPLGFTVDFFGITRSAVYVNNNGNVTFDSALSTFTPFSLTATRHQIIAPFFADVDTRVGNKVTYGIGTVGGFQAFGVDWPGVGYYSMHTNKQNNFQLVIINRPDTGAGNFDFEFNYNSIQWETGDASGGSNGLGGSSARVGYSNGTGNIATFFELNGSAVNGAFLDSGPASTSLIRNDIDSNVLGRYVFSVRDGAVLSSLGTGFWLGDTNNIWFQVNWAEAVQGVPTFQIPGPVTDVVFSATGAKNELDTVLGANFTIKSLTVNDTVPVSISGTNSLTIAGTTGTTGININGGAGPVTINSRLILGGLSQTVTVNNDGGLTVNGNLGGAVGLDKEGGGQLTLSGSNDYSGGTRIGGGVLHIFSDSALGVVPKTPTANLTFVGGGGTLQLGAGANAVTINANRSMVIDSGAVGILDTDGNANSFVVPGVISGGGALELTGGGTLTLSGSNSYSGGTTLQKGTILVDSANALGTGNVTVKGGTLEADPRQINVGGNYTQKSGGALRLRISGTNSSQNDFLSVKGRANLGGNLIVDSVGGFQFKFGEHVPIISATGGITGQFDSLDGGTIIGPSLEYESHTVILERLFATLTSLTPNEFSVAAEIDKVITDSKMKSLIDFLNKEPLKDLPRDFDLIGPADLSSLFEVTFAAMNVQQAHLESRLADVRSGSTGFSSDLSIGDRQAEAIYEGRNRLSYDDQLSRRDVLQPSPDNRWGLFVSGQGDFVHVDGDFNAKGYDFTTGGTTLGVDFRVNSHFAIGAAFDYANTSTDLSGNGRINTDSGRGGVYATVFKDKYYVNAYAGGGYNSYDTRRAALQGIATGNSNSGEFNTFLEGGYEAHYNELTYGPITSFQYSHVALDGFTETGSFIPLKIPAQSQDSFRTNLGMKAYYVWKLGTVLVTPQGGVSWQHEFDYDALPIDAQFANGSGDTIMVRGPQQGRDSALLDFGVNVDWNTRFATYLDYDGKLNGSYQSNTISGGAQFSF